MSFSSLFRHSQSSFPGSTSSTSTDSAFVPSSTRVLSTTPASVPVPISVPASVIVPAPACSSSNASLAAPVLSTTSASAPAPISAPVSVSVPAPACSSISASLAAPDVRTSLPELASPGIKTNKTKTKHQKNKPTLATNPEEFAKENLKVERDFACLKVTQFEIKLKDEAETISILSARCSLLENQCKEYASKSASSSVPATSSDPPVTTPLPSVSPALHDIHKSSSSPLESLINLEVLKVIKGYTSTDTAR